MKQYFVEFDFTPSPQLQPEEPKLRGNYWNYVQMCYDPTHAYWGAEASTLKTAKGYISRIKKLYPSQNPHNFRIFDRQAPCEPCGHARQVFFQA